MARVRETEVRFPNAGGGSELRGVVHEPIEGRPHVGVVVAHGRSNDMRNPLVRRVASAAAEAGWWALRFNFRYVDAKGRASRDLSAEEDDLLGAVRFARKALPSGLIVVAGASMGARVGARASADPDIAGVVALGYPLHPRLRPEVRNPPEWPKLVKPTLFVQGDHDPFCDLARLEEDRSRLTVPNELAVILNAGHSFEPVGTRRDTFPEVWRAVASWLAPSASVQA
ncbi:MAG: alpha/beta hydrolase family protein [Methanobacteriota archaeon]